MWLREERNGEQSGDEPHRNPACCTSG